MTNLDISETKSSLHTLRNGLEQAERQILHLDRTNVEAFLVQLDQIEKMFADFGTDQSSVLAEVGRWSMLLNRITSHPKLLVDATSYVGGLPKLRSKHSPATGKWWHMDEEMKRNRTQSLKKLAVIVGVIVVIAGVLYFTIDYFTPNSGANNTTADVEQLVTNQKWQEALTQVQSARKTLPNDAELLIWEAVLSEQLADATQAKSSLAEAQQKFVGQPATFWTLVGTDRQMAGNLSGAEQAAQQALTTAPDDPQVTFLLASIAEARGDMVQAADYFSKTIALAEDSNPTLGVMAKTRMGMLMQQVQPAPVPMPEQTLTTTATSKSP